jgi:UDP-N-acetylmuramate--alanine ligase
MKHAVRHLHFVGIGGSGMGPIAEILHALGYRVTGSDQLAGSATERLAGLGITVFIGHAASHVEGADVVVTSSAVPADNPEVAAARAAGLPVVARALLLAELMRRQQGIAIAGTHGKTTTTALVASVLMAAGADPSFVIGGQLRAAGSGTPLARAAAMGGARLGAGDFIVAEADESDASFLQLSPVLSVVTNIDADHMQTYGHSLDRLYTAFADFLDRLPFYGRAVLCADDPGVRAVLPRVRRPVTTYGLDAGAALRAVDVQALDGARMRFIAQQPGQADLPVTLNLAGLHNVRNALAAIAVARTLRLADAAVAGALAAFAGVGRRFESHGEIAAAAGGHYTLVDDYGHHPVELAAVLAAARAAYPGRRLVLAFQPHRYTRTRDCRDAFAAVLARADLLILTEVYAAGEAPIAGADGASLMQAVQAQQVLAAGPQAEVHFVPDVAALPAAITRLALDGDIVITMGAGSIGRVPLLMSARKAVAP